MESQPQNPEFSINPENSHPCIHTFCASSEGYGVLLLDNG